MKFLCHVRLGPATLRDDTIVNIVNITFVVSVSQPGLCVQSGVYRLPRTPSEHDHKLQTEAQSGQVRSCAGCLSADYFQGDLQCRRGRNMKPVRIVIRVLFLFSVEWSASGGLGRLSECGVWGHLQLHHQTYSLSLSHIRLDWTHDSFSVSFLPPSSHAMGDCDKVKIR